MPEIRHTTTVNLTDTAHRRIDAFCDEKGYKKKDAVERLIEWFVRQDDTVKALVMGMVDEADVAAVTQLVLQRISNAMVANKVIDEITTKLERDSLGVNQKPTPIGVKRVSSRSGRSKP